MRRLTVCLLVFLGAGAAAGSPHAAGDAQVRAAVTLVLTTFYHRLDPRTLIVAEHDALARYGHLPPVPANLGKDNAPAEAVHQVDAVLSQTSVPSDVVVAAALKAIAGATHDPYTTYFTRNEYHRFDDVLDPQKLSGIGVILESDPKTKDLRAFFVLPDSPADRAGLRSGDRLLSINGASTSAWTIAQARSRLLGQPGTQVALTFQHPGEEAATSVTLSRSSLQPPTVYFSMLPGNVAYIYVATFGTPTSREFHTAVERSESAGARAYVVDLRNDGGGIVGTAIAILSNFIESGPLVSIESNGGEIVTFNADGLAIAPKPLAVLVNGYSASASEITAAAIAESGTGKLIGTRTYGKGVVQTVTRFPDGSAIKITTGRYYTPLNHDINGHGIVPDVVVDENKDARFGDPDTDDQLRKALEVVDAQLARTPA